MLRYDSWTWPCISADWGAWCSVVVSRKCVIGAVSPKVVSERCASDCDSRSWSLVEIVCVNGGIVRAIARARYFVTVIVVEKCQQVRN